MQSANMLEFGIERTVHIRWHGARQILQDCVPSHASFCIPFLTACHFRESVMFMDTATVCLAAAAAAAAPQIAAVFEFVGAVVLGGEVSRTVAGLITSPGYFVDMPEVFAYGMLCATISAWMWVTTATYLELTVSTTHAISEWNNSAANCPYTSVIAACTNGSTWVGHTKCYNIPCFTPANSQYFRVTHQTSS